MCSHYQGVKERERYIRYFGVEPPDDPGKIDLWPGYLGAFIRRHPHADVGDEAVPPREALTGLFGLVPHWSLDTKITAHTYNARSETVATTPSSGRRGSVANIASSRQMPSLSLTGAAARQY